MDDIPQGGAGGVPLHHDDQPDAHPQSDRQETPKPTDPEDDTDARTVPTVRGGVTVAEQKADPGRE